MNNAQTPKHPADVACNFLQRTRMKGSEVESYAQTYNWLQSILAGEVVCVTAEYYERLQECEKKLQETGLPVLSPEDDGTALDVVVSGADEPE